MNAVFVSAFLIGVPMVLVAGLFSGYWPISLDRSGLSEEYTATVIALGIGAWALPRALMAYHMGVSLEGVRWVYVIGAAIMGGGMVYLITKMLAITPPEYIKVLLMIWPLTMVGVWSANIAYENGLDRFHVIGTVLALSSIVFLAYPR